MVEVDQTEPLQMWEEAVKQVEVDQTGPLEVLEEAVRKQAAMWEDTVGLGALVAGERQCEEVAVVAGGRH